MKHLFDEKDSWTDESRELDREVHAALKPLVARWAAKGYSLRDVEYTIHASVFELCVCAVLKRRERLPSVRTSPE
jgi:hypothetical protein